jgi:hypothetical protein
MAVENQTIAPFYASNRNPFNYEKIEQVNRDVVTTWLTLEQMTQQLNLVDDESQDGYITSLGLAVRFAIEDYLGLAIVNTQYRTYYANPGFVVNGTAVYLDLPEASPGAAGVTINEVAYWTGESGATRTVLNSANYYYDPTGNRIVVTNGIPAPLAQNIANPIEALFTVNASEVATYPAVKQAGLLLLTHYYNSRDAVGATVGQRAPIPYGVDQLLRPYKTLVM